MAKKPAPAFPIGTRVKFICNNLGAHAPRETQARSQDDLSHAVGEPFGIGDGGLVVFPHDHPFLAADWVFVEVTSRVHPGERRYVCVTKHHAREVR